MWVIHAEGMSAHQPGDGHPESPQRIRVTRDILETLPGLAWREARAATDEELVRVHKPDYVARIRALRGLSSTLDPDTHTSPGTVDAALLAAGAAVQAVEMVFESDVRRALALVRPPGHHAGSATPMGFCLFNNVAVAAAHALEKFGCERVLIVDWDVHHGNGTQEIFEERREVLFFSLHQHPLFPGTGAIDEVGLGEGRGYTINVPLAAGMGDDEYLQVFQRLLVPIANAFQPQLVLISAGFDAHEADPLGGMELTERGYARMAHLLMNVADRYADGRVVVCLEGGYDLEATARSLRATVQTLRAPTEAALEAAEVPEETSETVADVVRAAFLVHAPTWVP